MAKREPAFPKTKLEDGREAYLIHDGFGGEVAVPVDNPIFAAWRPPVEDSADKDKAPNTTPPYCPENGC